MEILVVIAVIAIIGSVAFVGFSQARESTREGKLESDVNVINSASRLYVASGGMLEGVATAEDALMKMKTSAVVEGAVGLSGSFIDPRVEVVYQTPQQAAGNRLRAFWNPAIGEFELAREGDGGIHEFRLNEALATMDFGAEDRLASMRYSSEGNWIWDYTDHTPDITAPEGAAPGGSQVVQLSPPVFSPPAGPFPLTSFQPMTVTISNPNATVPSTLLFSLNGSPLAEYTGPLTVMPGGRLRAIAVAGSQTTAINSPVASGLYSAIPFQLAVDLENVRNLTYAEAGGAVIGMDPIEPDPVLITVANSNEIPEAFRSNSHFQISYTTDGSNPADQQNPAASPGPPFSGAFLPAAVDVSVEQWGNASSRQIRAVALSMEPELFVSSPEASSQLSVVPTQLPPPTINPGTQVIAGNIDVNLELPPGSPHSARIQFTMNGQDPGPGNNPVIGQPFQNMLQLGPSNLRARAYPPTDAMQWFDTSSLASAEYNTPSLPAGALVAGASVYGSGVFVGNLTYAAPPPGQPMNTVSFFSDTVIRGNLYLPGTPNLYIDWKGPSQQWTPANDPLFTNRIQGRHFGEDGVEIVPAAEPPFPRVKEYVPPGPQEPFYDVFFYGNSRIEGKVYRRYGLGSLPVVPPPTPKNNTNSVSYSNWDFNPSNPNPAPASVNPNQFANVALNTPLAHIPLQPGSYGTVAASSNSMIILGNPDPETHDVVMEYSFESLSLTGGADLMVVGPVRVTVSSNVAIHNDAIMGNPDHPEWLQLNFYSTNTPTQWNVPRQFHSTGTAQFHGSIVAPNGEVALDGQSVFRGAVTSYRLQITSNSVLFLLPPVIAP